MPVIGGKKKEKKRRKKERRGQEKKREGIDDLSLPPRGRRKGFQRGREGTNPFPQKSGDSTNILQSKGGRKRKKKKKKKKGKKVPPFLTLWPRSKEKKKGKERKRRKERDVLPFFDSKKKGRKKRKENSFLEASRVLPEKKKKRKKVGLVLVAGHAEKKEKKKKGREKKGELRVSIQNHKERARKEKKRTVANCSTWAKGVSRAPPSRRRKGEERGGTFHFHFREGEKRVLPLLLLLFRWESSGGVTFSSILSEGRKRRSLGRENTWSVCDVALGAGEREKKMAKRKKKKKANLDDHRRIKTKKGWT